MNAALPCEVTSSCAIADDPLGLTRIFDPEIQLAQWRRPAEPDIAKWLDEHASDLGSGLRQTLAPGQIPDLGRLPAGAGREALAADIALLAEILGELVDAETIGFRLEMVGKAMCPRLHVDRVGIRLSPHGVFNGAGAFPGVDAQYLALAKELVSFTASQLARLPLGCFVCVTGVSRSAASRAGESDPVSSSNRDT